MGMENPEDESEEQSYEDHQPSNHFELEIDARIGDEN